MRRGKLPTAPADHVVPDAIAEEDEPRIDPEDLRRGLDSLSPEHREVLLLCYFEGMAYDEISRAINASIGTVRSRIHYAKRALRQSLEKIHHEDKSR